MKKLVCYLIAWSVLFPLVGQPFAIQQLEKSPRHHEWVEVKTNGRNVHCFLAYPEVSNPALAVLLIHENRGLTDWVRSFADQLAAEGYLAIAPDLLSEFDSAHKKTSDFTHSDEARTAIYQLAPEQVIRDLNAVQRYLSQVPACNGKVLVAGFCWGGSQSFRLATENSHLKAALVFYGSPPQEIAQIQKIKAPVYGFYGENDERINATIPQTVELMKQGQKFYDYKIYQGAGHAFMRRGNDPEGSPENKKAFKEAWERLKIILKSL